MVPETSLRPASSSEIFTKQLLELRPSRKRLREAVSDSHSPEHVPFGDDLLLPGWQDEEAQPGFVELDGPLSVPMSDVNTQQPAGEAPQLPQPMQPDPLPLSDEQHPQHNQPDQIPLEEVWSYRQRQVKITFFIVVFIVVFVFFIFFHVHVFVFIFVFILFRFFIFCSFPFFVFIFVFIFSFFHFFSFPFFVFIFVFIFSFFFPFFRFFFICLGFCWFRPNEVCQ